MRSDYQPITIPEEIWREAKIAADSLGVLKHSFKQGEGNHEGIICQLLFAKMFGGKSIEKETHGSEVYRYDVQHPALGRVEVKGKLVRHDINYASREWSASIPKYNQKTQIPDCYAFFRINMATKTCWFCGYLEYEAYHSLCHYIPEGSPDPLSKVKKIMPHACFNLQHTNLKTDLKPVCDPNFDRQGFERRISDILSRETADTLSSGDKTLALAFIGERLVNLIPDQRIEEAENIFKRAMLIY